MGLSGIVGLIILFLIIGFMIFFLKYSAVFIPQNVCSSFRLFGVEQYTSNSANFSGDNLICAVISRLTCVVTSVLTCVVTSVLTCVVTSALACIFEFSIGPTVEVAASLNGTIMRKISPSLNSGSAFEYSWVYL